MAKPTKHYDTWRIRWTDETGKRRSQTFTDRKTADLALRKAEIEVEERRRGLRPPEIEPRRFAQAAEYWRLHRAPLKRSEKDDLSILKAARSSLWKAAERRQLFLQSNDNYSCRVVGRLDGAPRRPAGGPSGWGEERSRAHG